MESRPAIPIAIAVVCHAGRYLIGQRPQGVPLAGLWEFPGGKVHAGESAEAAARRECLEETGLDVEVRGRLLAVNHAYDHGLLAIEFFDCQPRDPQAVPNSPFQWVAAGELPRYEFPAANAPLISRLAR